MLRETHQVNLAEVNAKKIYATESPKGREKREEQLELIQGVTRKVHDKGCPLYLFGGFADEFLLNEGEIKNDHSDIDCIGMRADAFIIGNILSEVGCVDVKYVYANETYEEGELPVRVTAKRGVSEIDVVFMDMDEHRQSQYYSFVDDEDRRYAIYFDKNFFPKRGDKEPKGEPSIISPLGLIQTKLFYPRIKGVELREKDKKAAEVLRDKFFPGEDLADKKFMPEIVEIVESSK